MFSKGVSLVSTEPGRKSGEEILAWSKCGFKSNQELLNFPRKIGEWEGYEVSEREMTRLRETLGANVFLMRTYYKQEFSSPMFLIIIQAKESSAFHPPPVCYKAGGYLVEEDKDRVRISPGHVEADGVSTAHVGGVVPMKKLWLSKYKNGKVTERRIALYCYLRGNQFTRDTINMVRFSTLVPIEGSPDGVLKEMKDFAALTLPHLFEFFREYKSQMLFQRLANRGPSGWFILAGSFALPVALIAYPLWRRRGQ